MKTKAEALSALQRATKYGSLTADQLTKLTSTEIQEYHEELALFWNSGSNDADRDAAQAARLTQLTIDLAGAQ